MFASPDVNYDNVHKALIEGTVVITDMTAADYDCDTLPQKKMTASQTGTADSSSPSGLQVRCVKSGSDPLRGADGG